MLNSKDAKVEKSSGNLRLEYLPNSDCLLAYDNHYLKLINRKLGGYCPEGLIKLTSHLSIDLNSPRNLYDEISLTFELDQLKKIVDLIDLELINEEFSKDKHLLNLYKHFIS